MTKHAIPDFDNLVVSYRDQVYRQMLRLCGNKEDAEDVLTDALLTAYRRLDTLHEREAFGGWLAIIARRLCFHLRSQEKIHRALSLDQLRNEGYDVAPDTAQSPEERLISREIQYAVKSTVDSLPPELRMVYLLRDLEELSGEETATQLGLSLAAMKSRLHRARKLVRKRMDTMFNPGDTA